MNNIIQDIEGNEWKIVYFGTKECVISKNGFINQFFSFIKKEEITKKVKTSDINKYYIFLK